VTLPSHVVVLMLENRSFDHMLGFVRGVGDLTARDCNPVDPLDPASASVCVSPEAPPITQIDPDHSFEGTQQQLFGGRPPGGRATMDGFVASYTRAVGGDAALGGRVMECQAPAAVPVLAARARGFCVCTGWFASVPGPTWPNRFYAHAATSSGGLTNGPLNPFTPTIYDRLDARAISWRIYVGDIAQAWSVPSLGLRMVHELKRPAADRHFAPLAQFAADLTAGALPAFTFLEPHYFPTPFWSATDQHPPHDVRLGEALIAHVYQSLVASNYWRDSLLVVTYDEHGGFYDRRPPPRAPSPDGVRSADPPFDFRRLGVRVPTLLISPYIPAGTRDRRTYDHAAIPATLNRLFDLGSEAFLTERDRRSLTFESNLSLDQPRGEADIPRVGAADGVALDAATLHVETARAIEVVNAMRVREASAVPAVRTPLLGVRRQMLSEHQIGLAALAEALARA
jgi:phospholipase C